MLTRVTGTGCLLSSILGVYAAVEKDYVMAAIAGLAMYGVAAEMARQTVTSPGSFQIALLDTLYEISAEHVVETARITKKL